MFITQQQLNEVLDNHFMSDGRFDQWHFDASLQLILDNHHDLYDLMRSNDRDPDVLAFDALRRFAQEASEGEYGTVQGLTLSMLILWYIHRTVTITNVTRYIESERAEAQREKEEASMNTAKTENNSIAENRDDRSMKQIIAQAEQNIRQAIKDYGANTCMTEVLDDVSDDFIRNLARDSSRAKQNLRELFSTSPAWNSKLDALVINGTRTHDKDYDLIHSLARDIFAPILHSLNVYTEEGAQKHKNIMKMIAFFSTPFGEDDDLSPYIAAIEAIAPGAYKPNRKLSRVFKAICVALSVADEVAGSDFQRNFARLADELSSKKIDFKLFASINPAHFITMSNPKGDYRGNCLTSCHSFNSTDFSYNNGCSGYARDEFTFIAFTVDDPSDEASLNNRKITRQLFAYRPGSGLLMQSRLYVKSGGTDDDAASVTSKLYRDLIQREISALEDVPNLWKTHPACGDMSRYIDQGCGFGGYPDWEYSHFGAKVCLRADFDPATAAPLLIGTYGLCIVCGEETSKGLYCGNCENTRRCEHCDERCNNLYSAYDACGNLIEVCDYCLQEYFTYCDGCHEYHHNDCVTEVDGQRYCDSCLREYCEECGECGELHLRSDMTLAHDQNECEVWVCEECLDNHYTYCEGCDEYYHDSVCSSVVCENGREEFYCPDCVDGLEECPHCGRSVEVRSDGTCPNCGVVIEKEEVVA